MLNQVNFWAERVAMLLDLLLLARMLQLRLQKTYTFIVLFASLEVFYDCVGLLLGTQSEEFGRVLVLSRFVYGAVFPLAIWDVFEEAKPMIEKVRRLAMSRMISSLIFISLWGLLITAFTGGDDNDTSHYFIRVAIIIWTGAIAAALAFLWVMKRGVRMNGWQLPHNTSVWFLYFRLVLILDAISSVIYVVLPALKSTGWANTLAAVSEPVLQACAIALTAWCIFRLRAVPSDQTSVPAQAAL